MGRSSQTFGKKEREKKKAQKKREKQEKKRDRKSVKGTLDNMTAYIDEFGNISDSPPDPKKMKDKEIKPESIDVSVPKKEERYLHQEGDDHWGIVTHFNDEKGYGFIKDKISKDSIFVHINELEEPVKEGDRVTFEVEMGRKGYNAVNVKMLQTN